MCSYTRSYLSQGVSASGCMAIMETVLYDYNFLEQKAFES
jgi:hypothetical protein